MFSIKKIIPKRLPHILLGLLVLGLCGYFIKTKLSSEQIRQIKTKNVPSPHSIEGDWELEVSSEVRDELERFFTSAPLKKEWQQGKWNCPALAFHPQVPLWALECHPALLECWAQNKFPNFSHPWKIKRGNRVYIAEALKHRDDQFVKVWGASEIAQPFASQMVSEMLIKIYSADQKSQPQTYSILFADSCRGVRLPERIYSFQQDQSFLWDTFGRDITLDRQLVTRGDVDYWVKNNDRYKHLRLTSDTYWYEPALNLSREEKNAFCHWRKAHLLEAHYFDAATFFLDPQKQVPQVPTQVPWAREDKAFYNLNDLSDGQSYLIKKCKRGFFKECRELKKYQLAFMWSSENISWLGLRQVFGGPPEEFQNPFFPSLIYKLSDWNQSFSDNPRLGIWTENLQGRAGFRCFSEKKL
jgi:hypothetical protein